MNGCRHAVLSLPQRVEPEGLHLHDRALRQQYPINETAARVLAHVDGRRSVEEIAERLADDGQPEELVGPILAFADVLNRAYLLNASKPWSWREARCALQRLWTQLFFSWTLPVPDGKSRVDLTARQQRSMLAGALRVAGFSLGKILPILGLGAASIVALSFVAGTGFELSTIKLLLAFCLGTAGCMVLHELGHYVALARFEPPPRRLFLKSSLGTCGLSHVALPGRLQGVVTTAAGPLLPLVTAGVLALMTPLPGEIRLVSGALAVSQVVGLTALTSDGRQIISLLSNRQPRAKGTRS